MFWSLCVGASIRKKKCARTLSFTRPAKPSYPHSRGLQSHHIEKCAHTPMYYTTNTDILQGVLKKCTLGLTGTTFQGLLWILYCIFPFLPQSSKSGDISGFQPGNQCLATTGHQMFEFRNRFQISLIESDQVSYHRMQPVMEKTSTKICLFKLSGP